MTRTTNRSGVVLLGNRRQSLTVARQLSAAGHRVIVGRNRGDDRDFHTYRSRAANAVWPHDHWRDHPFSFAAQLDELLDSDPDIATIFPIDESAISHFDRIRTDLDGRVGLALANSEAIRTCLNKDATLRVASEVGVATHAAAVVDGADVAETCHELGLPVVVKPMDDETIRFGVKADILRTSADVETRCGDGQLDGRRVMVQRYATGPRHNVYFAAASGQLLAAAEVRIARTDRVDGTGLAVAGATIEPTPSLHRDTEALVGALDYTGVGCAQFVREPDTGESTFLELNPRLGANFAVVERAGLPLALMATTLASGSVPAARKTDGYRRDVRFAWTFGALAGLRFERRQGVINTSTAVRLAGRSIGEGITTSTHITWAWNDPIPTLLEFARPVTARPTSPP